mmetsp:Transcript_15023/g.29983  ORF Transcript_15023/g.29983 Transcript_15023/m.29983 type:complete len:231 (+) Transcript_15023:90-782(+)
MGQICCGGPERDRTSSLLSSAPLPKAARQFHTVDQLENAAPRLYSPPPDGGTTAAATGAAAARAVGLERNRLLRIVSETSDAMVPVLSSYLVGMPHADPGHTRGDGHHAPPAGASRGAAGPLDRLGPCAASSRTAMFPLDAGPKDLLPASQVFAALARGVDFWPKRPPAPRGEGAAPAPVATHELVDEYIDLYVVGNRGRNTTCGSAASAPFPTVEGMFANALPIVENLP